MSRDTIVTGSKLTALANSIRTKAGTQETMTLDEMKTTVDNISTDSDVFAGIIDHSISGDVVIPEGITKISYYVMQGCTEIASLSIPSTVDTIESYSVSTCTSMVTVNIAHGVRAIKSYAFGYDYKLQNLTIPSSLRDLSNTAFAACSQLENVTIENGFNCNNLDLQSSTQYSAATIVSWLNALADLTGQTAKTLTIGPTNINKLTAAEIAIATNKNWNLA